MAETKQITVPDIGDFKDVNVIEVLVKAGDTVKAEDSLITLETDKATMDVPSPSAGVVKEVKVKAGDKVSQGSVILLLESGEAASAPATQPVPTVASHAAQTLNPSPALPLSGEGAAPPLTRGGREGLVVTVKPARWTGCPISISRCQMAGMCRWRRSRNWCRCWRKG